MANYLNRPSIFEIATAFEDGNEGYIKTQRDGYERTYKTLSNDEKSFVFRHPILAYEFNNNANKAKSAVEHFPNKKDGYGDAIRHCYWCALNQVTAGYNSSLAEEYGNAHENKPDNNINEKQMDLHNNAVGYKLGNEAIINGWSEEELLNKVIDAANNGKLYMLK
ncbi:MAG: hypothetical protein IJY64_04460 [Bacteroidaceae bacterium]|nr:hypothetical protein [Bacteroidaceae bacterium]